MLCSACANENPEGSRFCAQCGAAFGLTASDGELSEYEEMRRTLGLTGSQARPEAGPMPETGTGMSPRWAGALCYVLGWITGLIFSGYKRESAFVQFHAWQSVMVFGVLDVVTLTSLIMWIAGVDLLGAVFFVLLFLVRPVLWIILIIQAATGRMWKVPGAGKWAERRANK